VELYPPKVFFSKDHVLAPRGCCATKFLHALENDHVLLAHLPLGMGVPSQYFFKERLKIGLKSDISMPAVFEVKGVPL